MATEPTCFGDLVSYGEDVHFPSFLCYSNIVEDADFAEELQFQETLKASLIVSEMSSNVSSSSSLVMMGEFPFPAHSNVKEKGGSSLSFCEICLERLEGDRLVNIDGCVQAFCSDCSKTIELSKEEYCSQRLSIHSDSGNYSAKSSTATNNPQVQVNTEQRKTDIVGLKSADIDGESKGSERKDKCRAEKLKGAQSPDQGALRCKDEDRKSVKPSDSPGALVHDGNEDQSSKSESLSPKAVDRRWIVRQSIGSAPFEALDDGQQQTVAHDIVNIVDVADALDDEQQQTVAHGLTALNGKDKFDFYASPNNILLKDFFMRFEKLTTEKINEPSRLWLCPVCERASHATKWLQGLQALISHAKTRACKRCGPHRVLAQLLEKKLLGKETSAVPAPETLGKWKGLKQENQDHEIVWPPMVVIRNTCPTKNENRKWVSMTSQELLDLFSAYDCIAKAHHPHDSQGHRGMSVLIFEGSARGYLEAERLHKHLADQGTDRNAWNHSPFFLSPDGKHQLYGYLAVKEDVDLVNQSSKGSSKLKYSMRSYREMVVKGIRKLYDDNHQLIWLKNRVAQKQMHPKDAKESFEAIREKLNQALKENHVLRERINLQHEQHLEEMNCREQFLRDQIMSTLEARAEKEEDSVSTQNEGEGNRTVVEKNTFKYRATRNKPHNPKKNKGKEKEEIVAETDDEQMMNQEGPVAAGTLSIGQLELGNCAD